MKISEVTWEQIDKMNISEISELDCYDQCCSCPFVLSNGNGVDKCIIVLMNEAIDKIKNRRNKMEKIDYRIGSFRAVETWCGDARYLKIYIDGCQKAIAAAPVKDNSPESFLNVFIDKLNGKRNIVSDILSYQANR